MIDFYTYPTFNGKRVSIVLEETGLEYQVHTIDLMKGEQRQTDFLEINPSGRIPTIIDNDQGERFIVTQSAAILVYLAEKSGQFLPTEILAKTKVMEWLFFHATDISPTLFDSFFLNKRCEPPQLEAVQFLNQRVFDLYKNFDGQLANNEYMAGDSYSIADMAVFPAINKEDDSFFESYPHLKRWYRQVGEHAAVQRGMAIPE